MRISISSRFGGPRVELLNQNYFAFPEVDGLKLEL